ncbi:hypothetical protein N7510_008146 [Penicillium lagena]|uniref:uncharacterized protein n=1 Tax=Penicillium lagena TaxID=94218 RepID=UPI002541A575|nr:uncharacterized protein N7510_008146 [Penicillium lagena]KAJ5611427.1 hypothetical protein N7510_008146 [Penicillium lagena]
MLLDLIEERQMFLPESDTCQSLALGNIYPEGLENKGEEPLLVPAVVLMASFLGMEAEGAIVARGRLRGHKLAEDGSTRLTGYLFTPIQHTVYRKH